MTISLDKLEALARAATPGPWHVEEDIDPPTYWVIGANREERKDGAVALGYNSNNDANDVPYIAACDPATILKLLAVVQAMKAVHGEIDKKTDDDGVDGLSADWMDTIHGVMALMEDAIADLDAP